jgi:hypothetical protein
MAVYLRGVVMPETPDFQKIARQIFDDCSEIEDAADRGRAEVAFIAEQLRISGTPAAPLILRNSRRNSRA